MSDIRQTSISSSRRVVFAPDATVRWGVHRPRCPKCHGRGTRTKPHGVHKPDCGCVACTPCTNCQGRGWV